MSHEIYGRLAPNLSEYLPEILCQTQRTYGDVSYRQYAAEYDKVGKAEGKWIRKVKVIPKCALGVVYDLPMRVNVLIVLSIFHKFNAINPRMYQNIKYQILAKMERVVGLIVMIFSDCRGSFICEKASYHLSIYNEMYVVINGTEYLEIIQKMPRNSNEYLRAIIETDKKNNEFFRAIIEMEAAFEGLNIDINKAYRKCLITYHPDKCELDPPELQKQKNEIFLETKGLIDMVKNWREIFQRQAPSVN